MSPESLSTLLVALVISGPGIIAGLSTRSRKVRRLSRQQRRDLDEWEGWGTDVRRCARQHNDEHHPDGDGAVPIPGWPPHMDRDEDST